MIHLPYKLFCASVLASVASVAATTAHAEDLCMSAFNNTIFFAFNLQQAVPASGPSFGPISGRTFGALAPCGTAGNIPLDGTFVRDGATQVVYGFQVHSVDRAGCGSVDYKVVLNLTTKQGPLDLYNAKNTFANQSTAQVVPCPAAAVASEAAPLQAGMSDVTGNVAR